MIANTVRKTYVNIYLEVTDSGNTNIVCVPTPAIRIDSFERSKLDAILAAITPCLDATIESVKKVDGYVTVVSEE